MVQIVRVLILLFMFGMCAQDLRGVEVKLTVSETAGVARKAGVVTSGIPFAKGEVKGVAKLSVSLAGQPVPAQFAKLATWDDGSVRWALMDTQVDLPANGKAELIVRDDGGAAKNVAPPAPVKTAEAADSVTMTTGPLELTVDRKASNLFKSIKVGGKERVGPGGRGLVLYTADGRQVVAGPPTEVKIEQAGPMRATLVLRGRFPGVHDGLLGYTARVSVVAGTKAIKLRVWLENEGRHGYEVPNVPGTYTPEWFVFDGLAVELGVELGGQATAACEGVEGAGKLKVLQLGRGGYDGMHYTISGPAGELKKGDRTDGVVLLKGATGGLTAAIRHFWQNHEKAIEVDGGVLRLWLWPAEGQWPRPVASNAADASLQALVKKDLYNLPGSVHKGCEMIVDLSGRDAKESSAELSEPLFAFASAAHYAATEAAPGLFAPPDVRTGDAECDLRLDAWARMAASVADPKSEFSIWNARQKVSGGFDCGVPFGWMDFGDLPVPGSGTVSLHYDWPWVVLLQAIRAGDMNAMRLADEMVRHRVEVDQDWTDRTAEPYRGMQRSGHTSPNFHCQRLGGGQPNVGTTWLAGVVLYYELTGDMTAWECIERTARFLPNGWSWSSRPRDTKDYAMRSMVGDMRAVSESMLSYCAMFDLTGDRKWLDAGSALFDKYVVPKWTEYGPHLHDRNQIHQQDYVQDDAKYCYSIQAFCQFHRRSGNAKVLELLAAGADKEFPDNFFDAPLYLSGLNAYMALVTGKKAYADKAVEQWVEAFPLSKNPPVFLPGNSQWSRECAVKLRTGHLLQYYFWKGRPK